MQATEADMMPAAAVGFEQDRVALLTLARRTMRCLLGLSGHGHQNVLGDDELAALLGGPVLGTLRQLAFAHFSEVSDFQQRRSLIIDFWPLHPTGTAALVDTAPELVAYTCNYKSCITFHEPVYVCAFVLRVSGAHRGISNRDLSVRFAKPRIFPRF